jgi:hypothetical protein
VGMSYEVSNLEVLRLCALSRVHFAEVERGWAWGGGREVQTVRRPMWYPARCYSFIAPLSLPHIEPSVYIYIYILFTGT